MSNQVEEYGPLYRKDKSGHLWVIGSTQRGKPRGHPYECDAVDRKLKQLKKDTSYAGCPSCMAVVCAFFVKKPQIHGKIRGFF